MQDDESLISPPYLSERLSCGGGSANRQFRHGGNLHFSEIKLVFKRIMRILFHPRSTYYWLLQMLKGGFTLVNKHIGLF